MSRIPDPFSAEYEPEDYRIVFLVEHRGREGYVVYRTPGHQSWLSIYTQLNNGETVTDSLRHQIARQTTRNGSVTGIYSGPDRDFLEVSYDTGDIPYGRVYADLLHTINLVDNAVGE